MLPTSYTVIKKMAKENLSTTLLWTVGDDMHMTYLTWKVMNAWCVMSSEPGQNISVHSQPETQPPSIFTNVAKSIKKSSKSLSGLLHSSCQCLIFFACGWQVIFKDHKIRKVDPTKT